VTVLTKQREGYGPPAPVQVFQWAAEFEQLLDIYRERAPKRVLEIGTYHGGSLWHWLQNARPGATVVSVDSYKVGPDNRDMYESWCPARVKVIALAGDSHDTAIAAEVKKLAPYQWVWIDGGHRYTDVKTDWELYGSMCAPGGIVCFHDILPASRQHRDIEVSQLWAELTAEHETEEIVADRAATWGGIGIVHV
jgi:predicted O-methyltransferase YrrM